MAEERDELEPARVMFAIRGNEAELRKCFFRSPSSSGFVRVAWHVDRTGVVQRAVVEDSSIDNADVETCLTARVGELRFGELAKPAKARWTYVFRLAPPPGDNREPAAKQRKDAKRRKPKRHENDDEPSIVIEAGSEGSLDVGKIDEVIHSGYHLFSRCYRDGIERNEDLEGTIRFRFVVGRDGRISEILDGESDLPDRRVIDCVAETFYALSFPAPTNGTVRVLYPLQLE